MDIWTTIGNEIQTLHLLLLLLTALLHIIFAGAVARDAASLRKTHMPVHLVSGITWALATLVGGVFVAVTYWILHRMPIAKILGEMKRQNH